MLSICISLKNRSLVRVDGHELRLFPKCVESIVGARVANTSMELVVADWESDDWPLAQWLDDAAHPIPVRVLTMSGTFSRGRGLNLAAKAARGNCLFFLDADALVSRQAVRRSVELAQLGKVYFPILYGFNEPEHRSGRWFEYGYGNCALSRETFEQIGGWPEYSSWGDEDVHFWTRASALFEVVREPGADFFHQWHPTSIDFKNRYGDETDAIRQLRAQAKEKDRESQVVNRLRAMLPSGTRYILVDEDRTDIRDGLECDAIPFLERNRRYWGPPADDVQAIHELERLRGDGAQFIVFPWVAAWWLEHYERFRTHLVTRHKRLYRDDLLEIFQLT